MTSGHGIEFERRLGQVAAALRKSGTDFLFLPISVNQRYVSGLKLKKSERLTAVVISGREEVWVVCPRFELTRIDQQLRLTEAAKLPWDEDEDPYSVLTKSIPLGPKPSIAVEPTAWFSEYQQLARAVPTGSFSDASTILQPLRCCKSDWEAGCIAEAIEIIDEAREAMLAKLQIGTSERAACDMLRAEASLRGGDDPSPHGVHVGRNASVPHGGSEELSVETGSTILVDAGVFVEGYRSDITRTTTFGPPPHGFEKAFRVVLDAQRAAIAAIRPGMLAEELDKIAREVIERAGYGEFFTHRLGHGLGLEVHEPPWIGPGQKTPLREGMVFTVEPGVYFAGKFGIRIEDNVIVTAEGCKVLSRPTEGFRAVG